MIICPMCEHSQAQGSECENCGKKLQQPQQAAPVVVAPLPELEQTHHAGGRVAVPSELIPELDFTRQKAGPDLPAQVLPEMETTRSAPVAHVPLQPVQDLDTGRAAADGVRTAAPTGAVVCRYCRNVQAEGMVCDRCGMRLPRARLAPAAEAQKGGSDEDAWKPCQKCRTPTRPGKLCSVCGTRVAAEP